MELTPNFTLSAGSYRVWQFPSGEIGIQLSEKTTLSSEITIKGSILASDHLMELLQLVEAIRNCWRILTLTLIMPYCAYSRQDRRCNEGEAFSLKVFTKLIDSCNFLTVTTYDNHSDVSTALLNNCKNIKVKDILHYSIRQDNMALDIEQYDYFISPDAGANKKIQDCSKKFNIEMIRADKIRDTRTGSILETKVFTTPYVLSDSTVLIIDDICQGGRTFEELAKAIKNINKDVEIHLFVTHGFFNNGFNKLKDAGITKFITTSSVPQVHTCNELIIIDL